jgi:iron complex outermembrane recepter protein
MKIYNKIFIISILSSKMSAQKAPEDTLRQLDIAPVTVNAARFEAKDNRLPYAVSALNQVQIQRGQAQRSLNEALVALPGIFTMNPDNFSQDLRISIRGFGARSAFGIRGIRLFVDGIPESTPDGTADVDNVDPGALQRLELLRGAAAGLYGNASGGVLNLTTEEPSAQAFGEIQMVGGSFGYRRIQAKTGFQTGKLGTFFSGSHNRATGYRAQSTMRQTSLNLKMRYQLGSSAKLSLLLNYGNSPFAQDAGGLTAAQAQADRQQARAQSLQFDGGEKVEQGRAGLVFEKRFLEKHALKLRAFATGRDFENRLAFRNGGWVEFERLFGGGNATYLFEGAKYRAQLGLESNNQRDKRRRFNNLDGKKGEPTFEQTERYDNLGAFWLNEFSPSSQWIFTAAARFDAIRLRVADRFLNDGDQSGTRAYERFNPSFGLVFLPAPVLSLYANLATNFETPTLNELSANPGNLGGFNPNLKPQESVNGEIGAKIRATSRLGLDLALFQIDLRNEFVPYQLADAPGRTFFRNAGKSRRRGIETALNLQIAKGLALTMNYTFSDFRYTDYESAGTRFDGKRLPALPRHLIFGALQWTHRAGFYAVAQVQRQSRIFANDANTAGDPAYALFSLRGGFSKKWKRVQMEPFAGANNLFNARYSNNLLINAAADRYFEPAADFGSFYGGVKIRVVGKTVF